MSFIIYFELIIIKNSLISLIKILKLDHFYFINVKVYIQGSLFIKEWRKSLSADWKSLIVLSKFAAHSPLFLSIKYFFISIYCMFTISLKTQEKSFKMEEKYSTQGGKQTIWNGLIKGFFKCVFFSFESIITAYLKSSTKAHIFCIYCWKKLYSSIQQAIDLQQNLKGFN